MVWRHVFAVFWLVCLPFGAWAQSSPCEQQSPCTGGNAGADIGAETGLRGWGFAQAATVTPVQNYVAPAPKAVLTLNITWVLGLLILSFAMLIFVYGRRERRNRRRARRHYCQTHVTVKIDDNESLTTIVDISQVGARLVVLPELVKHTPVTLRFDALSISGKVIWANEHFAAIDFEKSLSRAQVRQILRQPVQGLVPFGTKKGSARVGTAFSKHG
tara:strand:- start:966 stop:1613 length:648 start_codon:yes stop_codon:yes gene_type:complete